jgi:hypothetical protein
MAQPACAAAMMRAAAGRSRFRRIVEPFTRHLDEHQVAAAPRHDVDLADRLRQRRATMR